MKSLKKTAQEAYVKESGKGFAQLNQRLNILISEQKIKQEELSKELNQIKDIIFKFKDRRLCEGAFTLELEKLVHRIERLDNTTKQSKESTGK